MSVVKYNKMLSESVLSRLYEYARKSPATHKHAACLMKKKSIVAICCNNGRLHAEEKVLKGNENKK